ncbi:MAG TPA: 2-C-methyl-D-erythritol 4-phosphate cytidylyltransferase [Pyrinomonadaceae bacterium]|nr:2-C-methyl-D-erythritol 4-phosphate cytidylyltransferase [Pyrinomonadaceae bacterium]
MNTAIIVAAGSGQRFAAARPKQFIDLLGKPLIIRTLERFDACAAIDSIILVLSDEGKKEFQNIIRGDEMAKLRSVVTGGATRGESVRNGFDAIDPIAGDIVAVHDGARPLVSCDEITRTVNTAQGTGAACLVADVTDTIKETEDGYILRTIDRRSLRRALTPQAFRYEVLKRALERVDPAAPITDECYLVEKIGVKIALVEGSPRNIKITRPEDLILAEAIVRADSEATPHV